MCKFERQNFVCRESLSAQLELTTTKAESEELARQIAEDGVSKNRGHISRNAHWWVLESSEPVDRNINRNMNHRYVGNCRDVHLNDKTNYYVSTFLSVHIQKYPSERGVDGPLAIMTLILTADPNS